MPLVPAHEGRVVGLRRAHVDKGAHRVRVGCVVVGGLAAVLHVRIDAVDVSVRAGDVGNREALRDRRSRVDVGVLARGAEVARFRARGRTVVRVGRVVGSQGVVRAGGLVDEGATRPRRAAHALRRVLRVGRDARVGVAAGAPGTVLDESDVPPRGTPVVLERAVDDDRRRALVTRAGERERAAHEDAEQRGDRRREDDERHQQLEEAEALLRSEPSPQPGSEAPHGVTYLSCRQLVENWPHGSTVNDVTDSVE